MENREITFDLGSDIIGKITLTKDEVDKIKSASGKVGSCIPITDSELIHKEGKESFSYESTCSAVVNGDNMYFLFKCNIFKNTLEFPTCSGNIQMMLSGKNIDINLLREVRSKDENRCKFILENIMIELEENYSVSTKFRSMHLSFGTLNFYIKVIKDNGGRNNFLLCKSISNSIVRLDNDYIKKFNTAELIEGKVSDIRCTYVPEERYFLISFCINN